MKTKLFRTAALIDDAVTEVLVSQFGRDWDNDPVAASLYTRIIDVAITTAQEARQ